MKNQIQKAMSRCLHTSLKLMQWNIHSFNSNKVNLLLFMKEHQPDLVFMSETWMSPRHTMNISGYFNVRSDRKDGYGGLAIAIKHNINIAVINLNLDIIPKEIQMLAISVEKKLTILSIYCPPTFTITLDMWTHIINKLEPPYIILGDLNANSMWWGSGKTNRNGRILENLLRQTDLVVLNDGSPTRLTSPQQNTSAVDLTLSTPCVALDTVWQVIRDTGTSDHFPIICSINSMQRIQGNNIQSKRKYSKANWSKYTEMITSDLEKERMDNNYESLITVINKAANETIPCTGTVRQNREYRVMWWDGECTEALQKRKNNIKQFMERPNTENFINAKKTIAETQRVFKIKRKGSFRQFCTSLNRNTPIKTVWRTVRKIKTAYTEPTQKTLPTREIIPEIMNTLKICYEMPDFSLVCDNVNSNPFTREELKMAVNTKKNTTPGVDEISYVMIKYLPEIAQNLLLDTYNNCLRGGNIPLEWKTYKIYPFLKPNKDPNNANSYRCIAMTSCVGKVLQTMLKNRLDWFIENQCILSDLQAGFRRGKGIQDNINYLITYVQTGFGNNENTVGVFLDLKAAYDSVSIQLLYNKLIKSGIHSDISNLMYRMLENRVVYAVDSSGTMNGPEKINAGLPQGLPTSPILFNIYTNDMFEHIPKEITLLQYADDLVLLNRSKHIEHSISKMNEALQVIADYLERHRLQISVLKSAAVIFRKGKSRKQYANVRCNSEYIPWKHEVKYLGVTINQTLNWRTHVDTVIKKAERGINVMKAVSGTWWGADPKVLKLIYTGLVRPHLDFGGYLLKPCPRYLLKKLDRTQHSALRVIVGGMKSTPIKALLAECAETNLEERRVWLACKHIIKLKSIINEPLIEILENLETYILYNQGYWKNKETPYLIVAMNHIRPYESIMHSGNTLNCYEFELQLQMNALNYSKLELNKNEDNTKKFTYQIKEKWSGWFPVFTDGSVNRGTGESGFGIYAPETNFRHKERINNYSQINTAEVIAINKACTYILENNIARAVILTDSLTAIQQICNPNYNAQTSHVTLNTKRLIVEAGQNETEIRLVWLPSHTKIKGNEIADDLAKQACSASAITDIKLDKADISVVIKGKMWDNWQRKWENTEAGKARWYRAVQPEFPRVPFFKKLPYINRRHCTTLIRMRTGHILTKQHLYKINISESPNCECGREEDLTHILFDCPINEIPGFDLYTELTKIGVAAPLSVISVLQNLDLEKSKLIMKYLNYNKIKL